MSGTATLAKTEKHDLVMSRIFDAPVERVWQAWTDPKDVMRWWGPDKFTAPSAEINFHEGETSVVCMRAPQEYGGQELYSTWAYTKIVPCEQIEYTHNLSDKDGRKIDPASLGLPADFPQDQRHVVTFQALGNKATEMTITQHNWTAGQMKERAEIGLGQCLAKMALLLASS